MRVSERFAVVFLLVACMAPVSSTHAAESSGEFSPPDHLDEGWYARIETSQGRILVKLLVDQAPQSVAHFAALAEGRLEWTDPSTGETIQERYYDGGQVLRAVASNRFEAGRRSDGGRSTPQIYVPEERPNPVNFSGGMRMGLTRVGSKISATEFFITATAQRRLNGRFNCIGEVVAGEDVVVQIAQMDAGPAGRPLDPPGLRGVDVFAVGDPEALPQPKPFVPASNPFQKADGPRGR